MLLDLAFMFQKFHRDLPPSYCQFKEELHQMFPMIIDTKRLCFSLRQVHAGLLLMLVCGVCWSVVCMCLRVEPVASSALFRPRGEDAPLQDTPGGHLQGVCQVSC